MKVIINNRFRRMAHTTGDKCHLPLFMASSDSLMAEFMASISPSYPDKELKFTIVDTDFSSIWLDLPANTILKLDDANKQAYYRILAANNKLADIDWGKYSVYVQLDHFEALPERYEVSPSLESEGYQINRFNFRYNYYVPMHKLPIFTTEYEAKEYIVSHLSDWEIS